MHGAHNLPAEHVGTGKSVNRAANKRSHEDCMSQSALSNASSELGNSKKQYNKSSCNLTHSISALHTCKGCFSARELSFLTSLKHDEWVITTCGDRRPAKKASLVHEGSQKWLRNGQNTEDSHTDMHVRDAGFDVNDESLILMSPSPTILVEKENITSEGNCCEPKNPDKEQLGKQSSWKFAQLSSRVLVDVTNKFQITGSPGVKKQVEEDDVHRLHQRLKQIEFGRNTLGYERYLELVPKSKRKLKDPRTPNPKQVCSKRSWDGQVRQWRRLLHKYDPPAEVGEELPEDFALLQSNQKDESYELKKVVDSSTPCRPSHLKETTANGVIGVAKGDVELSIYEDWMDD